MCSFLHMNTPKKKIVYSAQAEDTQNAAGCTIRRIFIVKTNMLYANVQKIAVFAL